MKKRYLLSLLLIGVVISGLSNNIQISNVTLVGKNTTDNYVLIQFDLSWDNSWRTSTGPSNWDAAWIFIKYRIKGQTDWFHASLNWVDGTGTGDGHTVPAGGIIKGDVDNGAGNSLGVFVYANGNKPQGAAIYPGVQLRWQYGEDGVQDTDLLEVCVFGIEMVYVPEGAFELGNYNLFFSSFYTPPTNPSSYVVTSEAEITISGDDGDLYYDQQGDQTGTLKAGFPKGFKAFYCMKYEITQEQYVEFLLKLTEFQSNARDYVSGGSRHEITGWSGTYNTTNPYVACNFLTWADLAAYLDWAALRPMTELEYEKACRGTLPSALGQFAWGTNIKASLAYTLENIKAANESILTNYNIARGNLNYIGTNGDIDGPLRVGIFAAHPNNSGRVTAGATYYGIMEMTGNVFEQTVTVGNDAGRTFTGVHGDGLLDPGGNHNTSDWPGVDAIGSGLRGGGWRTTIDVGSTLFISSRTLAVTGVTTPQDDKGGRGVRTAP